MMSPASPKAASRWSASHAIETGHREENGRNGVHLQKKMVRLIEQFGLAFFPRYSG
jgi:hypothetical protein